MKIRMLLAVLLVISLSPSVFSQQADDEHPADEIEFQYKFDRRPRDGTVHLRSRSTNEEWHVVTEFKVKDDFVTSLVPYCDAYKEVLNIKDDDTLPEHLLLAIVMEYSLADATAGTWVVRSSYALIDASNGKAVGTVRTSSAIGIQPIQRIQQPKPQQPLNKDNVT